MTNLLTQVRTCKLCQAELDPRPVLQVHAKARVLIAGQAPGSKVHETGVPFDDPSGNRLREWMGIDRKVFYDETRIAILPMAFCYPGKGKSGDIPPPPRCAKNWRDRLLATLNNVELTLVIGKYAMDWHLDNIAGQTLTDTVKAWKDCGPNVMPLPHPSPRNNIWLKKNPWFEKELVPILKRRISRALS
jgi:uracil-DNA glycosylase